MEDIIESIGLLKAVFDKLGGFKAIAIGIIDIVIVVILAKLLSVVTVRIINHAFMRHSEKYGKKRKTVTVNKIVIYIVKFVICFFAVVAVLDILGLGATVTSLLATAGIGGVAIGFGAQSLVRDVITGAFILMEDQIAIGDYVMISDVTGTIEDITLRTTKLRDFNGEQHIVPNGQITVVTNYSRGTTRAVVDMPIPYEESVDRISDILSQAMDNIAGSECFAEKPKVWGIVEFADSAIMLRIIAKCHSMKHAEGARIIREAAYEAYVKNGIEVPYNKIEIMGESK